MSAAVGLPRFGLPPADTGQRGRLHDHDAGRPAVPGAAVLRLAADGGVVGDPGPCRQSQAGAAPDATRWPSADLPAAEYEQAIKAAQLGIIAPLLVGPPARVRAAADLAKVDISDLPLIESAHSHDSADKAVELARDGRAEALMKGSLHTDELMGAVVARDTGIRTGRRISHCFVMDVPGHKDPLIVTDAAVNILPDLAAKAEIVQNAPGGQSSHRHPHSRQDEFHLRARRLQVV
jgi:hypothetical protein